MSGSYRVILALSAEKSLKKIPLPWRSRIMKTMEILKTNPFYGEKMLGELEGRRKIRIWPYRIIYRVDQGNKTISIIKIGHRGSIGYK